MKIKHLFRRFALASLGLILALSPWSTHQVRANGSFVINGGPVYSATIKNHVPVPNNHTMKGVVVTVGRNYEGYVCYDTDTMRMSVAWHGKYMNFGNYLGQINHPKPSTVAGNGSFGSKAGPGWGFYQKFNDARKDKNGPLPPYFGKYKGRYVYGNQVILSYNVGGASVLELPGLISQDNVYVFTRTIQLSQSQPFSALVADGVKGKQRVGGERPVLIIKNYMDQPGLTIGVALINSRGSSLAAEDGRIAVHLGGVASANIPFKIAIWSGPEKDESKFREMVADMKAESGLMDMIRGGRAPASPPVVAKGKPGTGDGAFTVDTIPLPKPNKWNVPAFLGGFDFFPDGRAAVCTFHGDVWLVDGLDDNLEEVTWKRIASGLFQPLGLKIVNNRIFVTCRDALVKLHDQNGDDIIDFYESYNSDTVVTDNYHEFSMDLQTDSLGYFYYTKGAPWPPNVKSPHQGTVLKVSPDGKTLEVMAAGFRAPNGSAMSPRNELTVSDNQGHYIPASKLNLIKAGGFYGMNQTAQGLNKGGGYVKPVCWLPMSVDNSSGGQVWVNSAKWGPLDNKLLFTSYGKGTLFLCLTEKTENNWQGAMIQFPLKFNTGIMRARFNPKDGHLYVCGLRGWQTSGLREGGFYRVRPTGKPIHMPVAFHPTVNGVRLDFASPLKPASASDTGNFSVEQWNYKYSREYGSPEFSVATPQKRSRDKLEVASATLSAAGTSLFLEIPGIRTADQIRIRYKVEGADGTPVDHDIYGTIHQLSQE